MLSKVAYGLLFAVCFVATSPLTALQVLWSVCAIAGLLGVGWASSGVAGPAAFWHDVHQSAGALTVSVDLVLLAVPVLAFAVIESRRRGMRWPWIWIPLAIPRPGHS